MKQLYIFIMILLTEIVSAQTGSLDLTFGGTGTITTSVGNGSDFGRALIIQPDNKIVISGFSNDNGSNFDFSFVRYNTDGSLDNSFGNNGKVMISIRHYIS